MSNGDFWKDHFNSTALRFPDSPLKQVQATVNGEELNSLQCALMERAILESLSVTGTDRLIDLCCGNGFFTQRIAAHCAQIDGVDFSENLIATAALRNTLTNVTYQVGDVGSLRDDFFAAADKVYMCYALQHLSIDAWTRLLRQVASAPACRLFFVSGIPDKDRLTAFYDTPEKLAFHHQREEAGTPHIGKWWSGPEFAAVAADCGWQAQHIAQPSEQFSSHYRFDALLQR